MKRFYEVVVKYDRLSDAGEPQKVTEQYLFAAVSCGDAETQMTEYIQAFVKGEMDITSIKLSKYSEFIPDNILVNAHVVGMNAIEVNVPSNEELKYFAVKVSFLTVDDKGKTKKTPFHYITKAVSVEAANKTVFWFMKGTIADYEINNIVETKIIDVVLTDE